MDEALASGVDEQQQSRKYKIQTYGFFISSWLLGFMLIFTIPEDIMTYPWAQQFVDWVGKVVPMVEGLEQIRLYGFSNPDKAHLVVLPHISFYYAMLWVFALLSVPYMIHLVKGNFIFNSQSNFSQLMIIRNIIESHNNKSKKYYLFLVLSTAAILYVFINSKYSTKWTELLHVYRFSSGVLSSIFTIGICSSFITHITAHFLVKQSEKHHA